MNDITTRARCYLVRFYEEVAAAAKRQEAAKKSRAAGPSGYARAYAYFGDEEPPCRDFRMPWGKHERCKLRDIPLDYLQWILRSADHADPTLKGYVRDEINCRMSGRGRA